MTKTKATQARDLKLGDAELVLLAGAGQHAEHLIAIPATMKAVTRQRAAGSLIKRGFAEARTARTEDPIWREDEEGRFTLAATAAGLAAVGIEDDVATPTEQRVSPVTDASQPREGTKGALVVSLLSRKTGASINELIDATGWLPHTTRAALTGLRKRGYTIERSAANGGTSVYRIATAEPVSKRSRKTVAKAA